MHFVLGQYASSSPLQAKQTTWLWFGSQSTTPRQIGARMRGVDCVAHPQQLVAVVEQQRTTVTREQQCPHDNNDAPDSPSAQVQIGTNHAGRGPGTPPMAMREGRWIYAGNVVQKYNPTHTPNERCDECANQSERGANNVGAWLRESKQKSTHARTHGRTVKNMMDAWTHKGTLVEEEAAD